MIVVFGSLNADFVFPVPALPREGETVACEAVVLMPGGKGANQAAAAARAGAEVRLAGCVGGDSFGDLLIGSLEEAGVGLDDLERVSVSTGCAAVIVDAEGRNQIAVASGANLEAKASQVKDGDLGPGTIVLLQNEVRSEENRELARRARVVGARVLFNAAPAGPLDADLLRSVDCLLVNEIEATNAAKAAGLNASGPIEEARALAGAFAMGCVVTMGSGGAYASLPGGEWQVDALPVEPVDTTGAGDAFVGVFAASLDAGLDAADALHRASVAGSLACLTEGAQPSMPSAADIDQRLAGLAPVRRL
jgi:ribokinase